MFGKFLRACLTLAVLASFAAAAAGEISEADRRAAENGDAAAQYGMFESYTAKDDTCDSFGQGMDWLRRSAEAGYGPAQLVYGRYQFAGNDAAAKEQGRRMLRQAAAQGYPEAQQELEAEITGGKQ